MSRILALDIGGTFLKSAYADEKGNVTDKRAVPSFEKYAGFLEYVRCRCAESDDKLAGVVAAVPGGYDFRADSVFAPNLPSLNGRSIGADLKKTCGLPVRVENDANLAALGEYVFAEQKKIYNMIFITLGTGVGGGAVIGGRLLGGSVTAFEIGHLCVAPGGRPCECGKNGCLDEYCSSAGLVKEYLERGGTEKHMEPGDISRLALAGDPAAVEAFDRYGEFLGAGLAEAANLIRPDFIKIGGGLSELSVNYLARCREVFESRLFPLYRGKIKIDCAKLKNDAGILGCAAYFFDL